MKMSSTWTSPVERCIWRWAPSPQSKSRRSPPRRARTQAVARRAVGTEPPVPRKTRSRSTRQPYRRWRRSHGSGSSVARRVTVVEHQVVAVRVGEERHMADARVERVAGELDPPALELSACGGHVVDVDRQVAVLLRLELPAQPGRLPDAEARLADPELVIGLVVRAQPKRVDVERSRAIAVGRGDCDEIQLVHVMSPMVVISIERAGSRPPGPETRGSSG